MTHLIDHQIKPLIDMYKLTNYVETGTFYGQGIKYAIENGLSNIYSCDINETFIKQVQEQMPHWIGSASHWCNGTLRVQDSLSFLKENLPSITGKTLFFLDAHFPKFYDKPEQDNEQTRFPLLEEVKLIINLKNNYQDDVIICDDIRVLAKEENPFHDASLDSYFYSKNTLPELIGLLSSTHDCFFEQTESGTAVFIPKPKEQKLWGYINCPHDAQKIMEHLYSFKGKKKIVVCELGVGTGRTANRIVDYLKSIGVSQVTYYGIDNLNLSPEEPTFEHEDMIFIKGDRTNLKDLPKVDFAFVDACHCAECVFHDSIAMSKIVKKGGSMAFHDTAINWQYPHGESQNKEYWQHEENGVKRPLSVVEGIVMSRAKWDGQWQLKIQSGDDLLWGGIRIYHRLS